MLHRETVLKKTKTEQNEEIHQNRDLIMKRSALPQGSRKTLKVFRGETLSELHLEDSAAQKRMGGPWGKGQGQGKGLHCSSRNLG